MRFSVEAAALKSALALLAPVMPRRASIPILEHALLSLEGDRLTIAVNDLDQAARVSLAVAGEASGAATVSAMRLKSIADTAPDGAQISVALAEGNRVDVKCGRSRFHMAGLDVKDFPAIKPVAGTAIGLEAGAMARYLTAACCASTEDTRYYLNGIFLHRKGKELCATATDGHKLAHIPLPLPEGGGALPDGPDNGEGFILPNVALRHLGAMVGERACRLTLSENAIETQVAAEKGASDLVYRTRLVEGQFPTYSRVIPERKNFDAEARVDIERFRAALKRCAVALAATDLDAKGNRKRPKECLALHFSKDTLRIEAVGEIGETASEEMDIAWAGPDLRCGFNWRYLDIVAETVGGEHMRFWPDAHGPARFEAEEEDGRVFVVMPVRL